jgi:hypothetical protein
MSTSKPVADSVLRIAYTPGWLVKDSWIIFPVADERVWSEHRIDSSYLLPYRPLYGFNPWMFSKMLPAACIEGWEFEGNQHVPNKIGVMKTDSVSAHLPTGKISP